MGVGGGTPSKKQYQHTLVRSRRTALSSFSGLSKHVRHLANISGLFQTYAAQVIIDTSDARSHRTALPSFSGLSQSAGLSQTSPASFKHLSFVGAHPQINNTEMLARAPNHHLFQSLCLTSKLSAKMKRKLLLSILILWLLLLLLSLSLLFYCDYDCYYC